MSLAHRAPHGATHGVPWHPRRFLGRGSSWLLGHGFTPVVHQDGARLQVGTPARLDSEVRRLPLPDRFVRVRYRHLCCYNLGGTIEYDAI